MSDEAPPTAPGALMLMIQTEIARCDPVTVVYARHAAALDVTYEQFCKLIASFAGTATPLPKLTPIPRAPVLMQPAEVGAAKSHNAEDDTEELTDLLLAGGLVPKA